MCAQGGKSAYILSKLDDNRLLVSNEINPIRLGRIRENSRDLEAETAGADPLIPQFMESTYSF